jgi:acetyltransferase-like isoleucine patch superfamily enzyme
MPVYKGDYSYIIGDVKNVDDLPVVIGKFCSIAAGLHIANGEHCIIKNPSAVSSYPFDVLHRLPYPPQFKGNLITIGNDVWIGVDVYLKHSIIIGDGAVIGAKSVVTKNVAPYEIVGGNPARHIRFRFNPEQVKILLQIKWWDWKFEKIVENISYFHDIDKFIEKFGSEVNVDCSKNNKQ